MEKIVHLIFTLEPGGAENLLIDIANEQVAYTDVSIILINNRSSPELIGRLNPGVHFYSLKREEGNKKSVTFLFRLWSLLLRIGPDVIHCHNHKIIRLLPFHKQLAVLTVHCMNVSTEHLNEYRKIYSISDAVSCDIKKRSGIISPVVINGINFLKVAQKSHHHGGKRLHESDSTAEQFAGNSRTANLWAVGPSLCSGWDENISSENVAEPQKIIRLVQIGRLKHEIKGQDLLLTALHSLSYSAPHLRLTVDFIGSGTSEPLLRKITAELGLDDCVSFLGDKPRTWIYDNLYNYDILIQPSRSEGFGLTIIEGIAAGLPVIASDEPGPAEIVVNTPSGHLFRSGDPNHLALVIQKLVALFKENDMQHLCDLSRSRAFEKYSVSQTAKEYLKRYSIDFKKKAN